MKFEDMKHGDYGTYSNHGCRCQPCKTAWAVAMKSLRDRRRAAGVVKGEHGKYSTYSNWGCRCRLCTDDHNANNRRTRAAARARKRSAS